ncbi:MAG: hypothetical protein VW577_06250 [Pelagibacteraceae bacterium]
MKKINFTFDNETYIRQGFGQVIFDIAWAMHYKNGQIIDEPINYLVLETMTTPDAKNSHYQAKHYTDYIPMLDRQEINLMPWNNIVDEMHYTITENNVNAICAYNLGFDLTALRNTDMLINGKITEKMQEILNWKKLCIWNFVCKTIAKSRDYKNASAIYDWYSRTGNMLTGAEYAYKFVSQNPDFAESHTAKQDVIIEAEILSACYDRKTTIPYNELNAQCWKIAQ